MEMIKLLTVKNIVILIFLAVILGFLSRIYSFLIWVALIIVIVVIAAFVFLRREIYKKINSTKKD